MQCILADGRPAADMHVIAERTQWRNSAHRRAGKTNQSGLVVWNDVATGEWTASFQHWHKASGHGVVTEGQEATLVLREPLGGTLDIQVVDENQRPLPFCRLKLRASGLEFTASDWAFSSVPVDGVLRVDPYTDRDGKRSIQRVLPGVIVVAAEYGSRRRTHYITIKDREHTSLTVTLQRRD